MIDYLGELAVFCLSVTLSCIAVMLYLIGRDVLRILRIMETQSFGIGEMRTDTACEDTPGANASRSGNESEKSLSEAAENPVKVRGQECSL